MAIFDNIVPLPADQTKYTKQEPDPVLPDGVEVLETPEEPIVLPSDKKTLTDEEILRENENEGVLPTGVKPKELDEVNYDLPEGVKIKKLSPDTTELPKGDSHGKLEDDSKIVKPDSTVDELEDVPPNLPDGLTNRLETDRHIKLPNTENVPDLEDTFVTVPTVDFLDPNDLAPDLPHDANTGGLDGTQVVSPPTVNIEDLDNTGIYQPPSIDIDEIEDPFVIQAPNSQEPNLDTTSIILAPETDYETPGKFGVQSIEYQGNSRLPEGLNNAFNIIDEAYTNLLRFDGLFGNEGIFPLPMPAINLGMTIKKDVENFVADPLGSIKNAGDIMARYSKPQDAIWKQNSGISNKPNPLDEHFNVRSQMVSLPEDPYKIADLMDRPQYEILAPGLAEGEEKGRIVEDIKDSQFAFQGRKSVVGMTLHPNHLWDIKVERWGVGPEKRTWVPEMGNDGSYFYSQFDKDGNVVNEGHKARSTESYKDRSNPTVIKDFEDLMPVLSYNLSFKSLTNKDVELFNGSSISIPEAIRRASSLNLEIVDDENKRWRRWFQRYIETMYNEEYNIVKPYKTCCVAITIYQYRADWMVLSHKVYLAVLKNYEVASTGAGNGMGIPDILDTEWSIVGEIQVTEKNSLLDIS